MKDKKQLTQLVVLGVLVAVFAGYFVMKLTAGKPKPAPRVATGAGKVQKGPMAQPAGVGAGPESPGAERFSEKAIQPKVAVTPVVIAQAEPDDAERFNERAVTQLRDPFVPMMASETELAMASRHSATRTAKWVPPLTPTNFGPLPAFGAGPQSGGNGASTAVRPAMDEFPQFVLTGVITGKANVAIIRLGEGRYIVREGQRINGIYQVVSVSQVGVLLSRDGKSVFLKLGGDGNAS